MADATFERSRLATVFGGSGFLGRHIVRALVRRGWRVRVAVRRPDLAFFLQPIGGVGQIEAVQANLRYPGSVAAALEGAEMAINVTGVKAESGAQTYRAVHVEGAAALARAAKAAGVAAYAHVSGIGADPDSGSPYIASKGQGEKATVLEFPGATILRPSVVFGPEDDFFNRFGALARFFWVIPLFGGGRTRLQPVYVGDVARAAVAALAGETGSGVVYELGGPQVMTLREAADFALRATERRRLLVGLPADAIPFDRDNDDRREKGFPWRLSQASDGSSRRDRPACDRQCGLVGRRRRRDALSPVSVLRRKRWTR